MDLFDDIILQVHELCQNKQELEQRESTFASIKNNMIFQSDVALELGKDKADAISMTLASSSFTFEDSLYLIGDDLCDIKENRSYARIAFLQVNDKHLEAESLFNLIKRLDFTKYHVSCQGYMMRISSMLEKEPVRISKEAIQKGISFSDIGDHFRKAYHVHPEVIAVKQVYISDPAFDYAALRKLAKDLKTRTNLIDHMTKDLSMNCNTCHEKSICDAIDGMKELHEQIKTAAH